MRHCKNCRYVINNENDFCASCGAKIIRNRLTIKNLLAYLTEEFLSYDNKFLKTFITFFNKPELVVNTYVSGMRKRYVGPINFFAISLTISGIYLFVMQRFFPDVMKVAQIYENQASQQITAEVTELLIDYNSLFYFILIPVLALISRLIFLKNGFNYTEHVVIYLYSMSWLAIVSSVISLSILLIDSNLYLLYGLGLNLAMILFHIYWLKRIFDLTTGQMALKTLLFILIFGFLYVVFSIVIVILLLMFTDLGPQDFAPPRS